jgi:hypothetical protein
MEEAAVQAAAAPVDHWQPLAVATEALMVEWFQPLNVVLLVGIVMFARFMHKANLRDDFSLVDALRGPDGKCSMKLIGYLVGIILGSWAFMSCATSWMQKPEQFVYIFAIYVGALLIPKILAEFIQAKYKRDQPDPQK